MQVVDDDPEPGHAGHLSQQGWGAIGIEVMEDQGRVDDIEGAVGVGERSPITEFEREPVRRRHRGRRDPGGRQHFRAAVDADDVQRPTATRRLCQERQRDVGATRPDIEHRQRAAMRRQRSDGFGCQRHPAQPSIDPTKISQVVGERDRVIEGSVEQFGDVDQAVHRCPQATPGSGSRRVRLASGLTSYHAPMIIVAGEALIDLIAHADGRLEAVPGGGPFNTARTIARLGGEVAFLGRLSSDRFGRQLRAALETDGVDLRWAPSTELPTTLAVAELDDVGAATYRFHVAETSAPGLDLDVAMAAVGSGPAAIHVGTLGLVMEPIATSLAAAVAAASAQTVVMVDPNCRPSVINDRSTYLARLDRILARADVVKVSADDLAYLSPGQAPLEAARSLLDPWAGDDPADRRRGGRPDPGPWLGTVAPSAGRGRGGYRGFRRCVRWRVPGALAGGRSRARRVHGRRRGGGRGTGRDRGRQPDVPASRRRSADARLGHPVGAIRGRAFTLTGMTRLPRLLVPVALALVALSIAAPSVAAAGARFPTQSLGNRGTDVQAIQWLLTARGYPVTADAIFGAKTKAAVIAWQKATGRKADGIVDDADWAKLIIALKSGASGPAVKAVQRELRAKRHLDVTVDGVWASSTTAAVKAFQRHAGIAVTGTMNGSTWRRLIAHFELPTFNKTSLCDYSVGNGAANWGTSAAINQVEAAARIIAKAGYGRVVVGDASFQHGGDIPGHQTHERGLDVDLRPMRKAEDQCRWGTNFHWSTYDRAATRALIKAIRKTAPGHVKLIYFNDPVLIREGLTTWYAGHDDHLHVRYCEKTYPLAMYDC